MNHPSDRVKARLSALRESGEDWSNWTICAWCGIRKDTHNSTTHAVMVCDSCTSFPTDRLDLFDGVDRGERS